MLRPIICTIILIINCIFYVVYVLPRMKNLPQRIDKSEGMQAQNENLLVTEYEKYYWPSTISMLVSIAAFALSGLNKSGLNTAIIVIVLVGVALWIFVWCYYKNILNKYNFNVHRTYGEFWKFRGDEGLHFAVVAGFTVYQIVLLFLQ